MTENIEITYNKKSFTFKNITLDEKYIINYIFTTLNNETFIGEDDENIVHDYSLILQILNGNNYIKYIQKLELLLLDTSILQLFENYKMDSEQDSLHITESRQSGDKWYNLTFQPITSTRRGSFAYRKTYLQFRSEIELLPFYFKDEQIQNIFAKLEHHDEIEFNNKINKMICDMINVNSNVNLVELYFGKIIKYLIQGKFITLSLKTNHPFITCDINIYFKNLEKLVKCIENKEYTQPGCGCDSSYYRYITQLVSSIKKN
jgi:hypothetical protein